MHFSQSLRAAGRPFKTALRPGLKTALLAGAVLGISALVARAMTHDAAIKNPPRGRFIKTDDVDLHFTEFGRPDAPPLVLLHGMGTMGLDIEMSGLVELAEKDFHVFVFDRPGYGHSTPAESSTPQAQAAVFVSALRLLGIKKPVVLGHSWGSLVAHAMAQDYPDEIAAAVLASGYHTPSFRVDALWLSAPAIPVIGTLMRYTVSPLLGRLLWPLMRRRMFAPAETNPEFVARFPVWMQLRPVTLLTSAKETGMLIFQVMRLRAKEGTVKVPIVLVAGDKDRLLMTFWQSGRMHKRRPEVPLFLAPGAGHMVHHSSPDVVMQAIHEALALSSGVESDTRNQRVSFNGRTLASQANNVGSIPITRSSAQPGPAPF